MQKCQYVINIPDSYMHSVLYLSGKKNQTPVFFTLLCTINCTELWGNELNFILASRSSQLLSVSSCSSIQMSHPPGVKPELCKDPVSVDLHKSQTEPILTSRFTN